MSEFGSCFDTVNKNGIDYPIMFHPLYGGGDSTIKTYEVNFSATIPGTVVSHMQCHNGIYSATGTVTSKKLFDTEIFVVLEHHIQITNNFRIWWSTYSGSYAANNRTLASGTISPTELSSENLSSITQEQESFLNTSLSISMTSTSTNEPSDQTYYQRVRISGISTVNACGFTYPNEYLFALDGRYIFQPVFDSRSSVNFEIASSVSDNWIAVTNNNGDRTLSNTVDKTYTNIYMKKPAN